MGHRRWANAELQRLKAGGADGSTGKLNNNNGVCVRAQVLIALELVQACDCFVGTCSCLCAQCISGGSGGAAAERRSIALLGWLPAGLDGKRKLAPEELMTSNSTQDTFR